jgi:hypothetical protein
MAASNELGEAFVRIRPKANPAEFQREVEKDLGPATKSAGDSLGKQIGETLTAGAFVAFSASVVLSAAQAEQAVGGTAAVFKDARGEIDAFAEGSAEALGLTEQATRQFSSQIGSALKGYGFSIEEAAATSQELITKGADLTALFGGTVPEAVQAMSAALRGEFDPLERYGVSLTAAAVGAKAVELGLAESKTEVTGQAKAMATLALINEQTADATGQFARETGTAAGQMAIATAKIGDARDELGANFLPVITQAAGAVGALANAFGGLPGPIQAAVVGMVAVVALKGPIGTVSEAVSKLRADFQAGGVAAGGFASKLSAIAKTGVVVAGLAAITGGIKAFEDATSQAGASFVENLPDVSDIDGFDAAISKAIARQNELSDELNKFDNNDFSRVPEGLGKAFNFFTSTVTGNVSEVGALKAEYDALTAALPAQIARREELRNRTFELADALGVSAEQAADLVEKFKGLDITQVPLDKLVSVLGKLQSGEITDVAQAAEDLGVGVASAGDEAQTAADQFDKARESIFGLKDAQDAYTDSIGKVTDAERSRDRAAQGIVDAQRSAADATRAISEAQAGYQDALRNTEEAERRRVESLESVEDAQRGVIEAQERLDRALQGPSEDDSLDLESARLRLEQQRARLGGIEDPTDKRLAEIDIRRAELDLARLQEEVDGRAVEAQGQLVEAQDRLTDSQRSADDAARAVVDARGAERDATLAISDANYNAQKAYQAVTDANINAEKATRDVERAKYDQLKASEDLRAKIAEEGAALGGANAELAKMDGYFRNLIALHPELESAIQPLLGLLALARNPSAGAPFPADSGLVGPQGYEPLGPAQPRAGAPFPASSGFVGPQSGIQIGPFNGVDAQEAYRLANQHVDQLRGI